MGAEPLCHLLMPILVCFSTIKSRQETFDNLVPLSFRIDMYTEGMADLNEMIIVLPLCPPDQKDAKIALIKERTTDRYLPVFEKVSGLVSALGHWTWKQGKIVPDWHSLGIDLHSQ